MAEQAVHQTATGPALCPACRRESCKVAADTVCHHLRFPLNADIDIGQQFYYCKSATCSVSYFSATRQYCVEQLQSNGQIKQQMVCYCFGISANYFFQQLRQGEAYIQRFFQQLDELAYTCQCACKLKNPAGRGCLKEFRQLLARQCSVENIEPH